MFTNKLFSRFFTNGQVIETIRGGGIFQPAVDKAIKLLEAGEWVSRIAINDDISS
jgi:monolysocardiolipin acyltransferase